MKITYDAELLIIANKEINTQRGGIYFVGYNIAKLLLEKKNIDLFFYVKNNLYNDAQYYLNKIYPNKKIKIITENDEKWFEIDIFYSFYRRPDEFIINNKNIKKYIQIHDLTPVIDNMLDWGNKVFLYLNKDYTYFTDSNFTKKELINYAKGTINDNNVHVTLLGYDRKFKKEISIDNVLKKYNIPQDKKYVFTLCGLYPRKNLIRNIRTFFSFIDKHNITDMVFIMGGYHLESFLDKFNEEIYPYKDRIIRAGYIDDEDLAYLYSGAEWFVYTSEYEGFGLPPLEAMACGCPVITSNNSSLPEVVGDSGIMIDWDSDEQHIEAYEKYYFNNSFREEMSKKGLERSKLFSWDKCVSEIIEVMYKNLNKKKFSLKKFIFNIKDEGIYRKINILGLKIILKPKELQLISKIENLENEINKLKNNDYNNDINLMKLESYKIFANIKSKIIK